MRSLGLQGMWAMIPNTIEKLKRGMPGHGIAYLDSEWLAYVARADKNAKGTDAEDATTGLHLTSGVVRQTKKRSIMSPPVKKKTLIHCRVSTEHVASLSLTCRNKVRQPAVCGRDPFCCEPSATASGVSWQID